MRERERQRRGKSVQMTDVIVDFQIAQQTIKRSLQRVKNRLIEAMPFRRRNTTKI